ncbi:hypothetical protein ACL02T_06385 [Pseudonocardia sp. RS010]|uniref:hypothetical protein n=1 Tax=Pseudonocardia sp. RS010 TaxID=3385979 RepID=UPI0039A39E9D
MGDDVVECAVALHLPEVGGVELHPPDDREQPGGHRPQPGRAGLAEDLPGTVQIRARREDQQVVDVLAVHHHARQVTDDHSRPAVRGGREGLLLATAESAGKTDVDRER